MTEKARSRRRLRATLLFTGLAIQLSSLFASQFSEFPVVAHVLAPEYYRASIGINNLRLKHQIDSSDAGYIEICDLLRDHVRSSGELANPRSNPTIANVKSFGTAWSSSGDTYPTGLYFTVTPIGGETRQLTWGLEQLQERVNALQQPNAIVVALLLFGIGSALDVLGFYLES